MDPRLQALYQHYIEMNKKGQMPKLSDGTDPKPETQNPDPYQNYVDHAEVRQLPSTDEQKKKQDSLRKAFNFADGGEVPAPVPQADDSQQDPGLLKNIYQRYLELTNKVQGSGMGDVQRADEGASSNGRLLPVMSVGYGSPEADEVAQGLKDTPNLGDKLAGGRMPTPDAVNQTLKAKNMAMGAVGGGVSSAEREALEDLAKLSPKMFADEIRRGSQQELDHAFSQPEIQNRIDAKTGVSLDELKNARTSAERFESPSNIVPSMPRELAKLAEENPKAAEDTKNFLVKMGSKEDLVAAGYPEATANKIIQERDVTNSIPSDPALNASSVPKTSDVSPGLLGKAAAATTAGASLIGNSTGSNDGVTPPPPTNPSNKEMVSVPQPEEKKLDAIASKPDDEENDSDQPEQKPAEPKAQEPTKEDSPYGDEDEKAQAASQVPSKDPAAGLDVSPEIQKEIQANQASSPLEDAQKQRNTNLAMQQLQQGAALFGAGMAKTSPDKELALLKDKEKYINLPMEQYKENLENQKFDPKSQVSQAYRDLYGKLMGKDAPPGWSAADLEKVSPMFEKYMQAKENAQVRKDTMTMQLQQKAQMEQQHHEDRMMLLTDKKDQEAERNRHNQAMEAITGSLGDARKESLIARTVNQAKNQLERSRSDLNQSRTAVMQANNIFASLGLDNNKLNDAEIDKIPASQLNKTNVVVVPEIAMEMNKLLTTGGMPSQATFDKLVPHNLNMKASQFMSFMSSNPQAANQAEYLRAYLKIASRVKQQREQYLKEYHHKAGAALNSLKRLSPEDYEELKQNYPEMDQTKQTAHGMHQPGDVVNVNGKNYKVGADGDSLEDIK